MGEFAGLRASGVNELALEVEDLDASERFYSGLLGLPVVDRWENVVWLLIGDRTRLGLWLPTVPPLAGEHGGSHVHFALHVQESDLDDVVDHLRASSCEVKVVVHRNGRGRSAYVTDPDEHVLELWTWDVARYSESALDPAPNR